MSTECFTALAMGTEEENICSTSERETDCASARESESPCNILEMGMDDDEMVVEKLICGDGAVAN